MSSPTAGQQAPNLADTFFDADGNGHSLPEPRPTLIGVYKSSCAASKAMFPMLERIHAKHGPGLRVLGVSQDSANITRSFARRYDITFPILVEGGDYPISNAFEIAFTPSLFVIDAGGKIVYTTSGFLKPQIDDIERAVADMLGVAPEPIVLPEDAGIPMFVPG